MNILIVRLSSIGDIFQAMTVLSDIKQFYPDSKIDWLVDKSCKNVVKLSPLINNVIDIPMREWKSSKFTFLHNIKKWKNSVISAEYDYIVDIHGLMKSAKLLNAFNGDKYGYSILSLKEKLSYFHYDHHYKVKNNQIVLNKMRLLVANTLNYTINLSSPNLVLSYSKKNILRNIDRKYILLFHGTSKKNKELSLDNWVSLIHDILKNYDGIICATYSNAREYSFIKELVRIVNDPKLKILDTMNFDEIVCLVEGCDFAIGVDTGLTHLASLMKKPTLGLYIATNPDLVGLSPSNISVNKLIKNHNFNSQDIVTFLKEKMIIK